MDSGRVEVFNSSVCQTPTLDKTQEFWYNISILASTNIIGMVTMDEIEELAEIFKALSDPTRLRLVKLLSECLRGECKVALCVNALAHRLGVTQSAVSQHLRVLRQAGLVRGKRRGTFVHYSLDRDRLEQYKARLRETLGEDFVVIK